MIVRCANCHTEFSLDDDQIGPEGATVRCSVCTYVFPVVAPPGANEQPWQIRTVEDLLFTAPDLNTLRTWITEGRLHPDDQVSRTGKHWLRLGDMPEFSSVFSGFTDLPQVFVEVEPATVGSALEELGPPPGFGETMPVVQGVDTDILVVRPESLSDFEVPVTARSAAVERDIERPPFPEVSPHDDASGPMPFPLGELSDALPEDDEDESTTRADESAARMRPRPRPYSPTAEVSAIPDVVEDEPVEQVRRRRPHPTVRYGSEEVHDASSMLDAVTAVVDEAAEDSEDGARVRPTAAAVERISERGLEPTSEPGASESSQPRSDVRPRSVRGSDDAAPSGDDERPVKIRRKHRTFAREIGAKPRRTWPLVAGLGLLAGVAVVFGVPSIKQRVLGLAGDLAGEEQPFSLESLSELEQARVAMDTLDPKALGEVEAALQGRLDEGKVPPQGVAEMKLAQVELLATRALDLALRGAAGGTAAGPGPSDDVERATRILAGVVAEDVVDRDHMRRVRARVRLAQGRPGTEILPLLPEGDDTELRPLVGAAPLWRDPKAPVPDGVISQLEALPERTALAELTLALAYARAGDDAKSAAIARGVLTRVPGHPTASILAGGTAGAADGDGADGGSDGGSDGGADDGSSGGDAASDDGSATTDKPAPDRKPKSGDSKERPVKSESVDSMIERGCSMVEEGDAGAGLELLRKARSRRPGDLDMLLCTGQAHSKQGRTRDALKVYEDALKHSPNFAAALRAAAKAADKLGEKDKAVRYYRRLLAERPGDAKAKAYVEANG